VSAPTSPIAFLENLLAAGIARGTPLLFATTGEILAERGGVLNLGVEGMMLLGASAGFAAAHATQSVAVGLLAAAGAAALVSLLFALVAVILPCDQVVSGLGLGFFASGLASILGAELVGQPGPRIPELEVPFASAIPILGPTLFAQSAIVYGGFLLAPLAWLYLARTRPGLLLRAVGEDPTAADSQGVPVVRLRTLHVMAGGALAGLGGAALSLGITPGWVDGMTAGQGWVAVGLVIFGAWDPLRGAVGSYLFGTLGRLPLDLQGVKSLPLLANPNLGYFLDMVPYLFAILVLALVSRGGLRRKHGAPSALGLPYVRGERGK
jgi:general nucleoside transport system permease protein